MSKVFAFDPPTGAHKSDDGPVTRAGVDEYRRHFGTQHTPSGPISSVGHGVYMANLGMRRSDVDKRTRMHGDTGRDYLNTVAAFEARRNQNRGKK